MISFLGDARFESALRDRVKALSAHSSTQIDLTTDVLGTVANYQALRACLEGDYEEVMLLAHAKEDVRGKPAILYPEQTGNYLYLSDRFFNTVHFSPKLKLFTLAVCQGEVVVRQYAQLRQSLASANVALRLAPPSPFMTWLYEKRAQRPLGGLVPLGAALNLITEAARVSERPDRDGVLCYLYRDPLTPGRIRCAHGQVQIEGPPDAFTRARWAKLTPDPSGGAWWITQNSRPKRQILRLQSDGAFINRKLRLTVAP